MTHYEFRLYGEHVYLGNKRVLSWVRFLTLEIPNDEYDTVIQMRKNGKWVECKLVPVEEEK